MGCGKVYRGRREGARLGGASSPIGNKSLLGIGNSVVGPGVGRRLEFQEVELDGEGVVAIDGEDEGEEEREGAWESGESDGRTDGVVDLVDPFAGYSTATRSRTRLSGAE